MSNNNNNGFFQNEIEDYEESEEEEEEEDENLSEAEIDKRIELLESELFKTEQKIELQQTEYKIKFQINEIFLAIILEMVPTFVYAKDKNGIFLLCNQVMASAYNMSVNELKGKTTAQVHLEKSETQRMMFDDNQVIETGRTKLISEEYFTDCFHRRRILRSLKMPAIFPSTNQVVVLSVSIDITRQKAFQTEYNSVRLANHKCVQVSAHLTHEVKTPLTGILCSASLLLDSSLSQQQNAEVSKIKRLGEALLSLARDSISFLQIQEEAIRLELVDFSLPKVLLDVQEYFADAAKSKDLTLKLDLYPPDSPGEFFGDPHRIWHIISNLVNNAIKFTSKGFIRITPKVVQNEQDSYIVSVSVQDTGKGIPHSEMQSLFSESTIYKTPPQQKGLGLPMSIKLAKLMGGNIEAQSVLGEGSTFVFNVPLKKTKEGAVPRHIGRNYNKNVLLVEDNDVNSRLVVKLLEDLGINVEIAKNGIEATEKATTKNYDLILMDLQVHFFFSFFFFFGLIKKQKKVASNGWIFSH